VMTMARTPSENTLDPPGFSLVRASSLRVILSPSRGAAGSLHRASRAIGCAASDRRAKTPMRGPAYPAAAAIAFLMRA
jgi:hypothetical protein